MNDVGFYHDSLSGLWLLSIDNKVMIAYSIIAVVLKYDNKYLKIYGQIVKVVSKKKMFFVV